MGIYEIVNKVNNKRYIGQSKDIHKRWKQHLTDLKNNKHHSIKLQHSWNKHGKNNFEFNIIEECSLNELTQKEIENIEKFNSISKGYNISFPKKEDGYEERRVGKKVYRYYIKYKKDINLMNNYFKEFEKFSNKKIFNLYYRNLNFGSTHSKTNSRSFKVCELILDLMNKEELLKDDKYYISRINFLRGKYNYDLDKIKKVNKNYRRINNINILVSELIYNLFCNSRHKYLILFINNIENFIDKQGFYYEKFNKFKDSHQKDANDTLKYYNEEEIDE